MPNFYLFIFMHLKNCEILLFATTTKIKWGNGEGKKTQIKLMYMWVVTLYINTELNHPLY